MAKLSANGRTEVARVVRTGTDGRGRVSYAMLSDGWILVKRQDTHPKLTDGQWRRFGRLKEGHSFRKMFNAMQEGGRLVEAIVKQEWLMDAVRKGTRLVRGTSQEKGGQGNGNETVESRNAGS